ncbi:MAG: hypothetical protein H6Q16_473 [Bacteroidetes bacterium]|nr:hypothetical protein [Bacteroidota bacterium]
MSLNTTLRLKILATNLFFYQYISMHLTYNEFTKAFLCGDKSTFLLEKNKKKVKKNNITISKKLKIIYILNQRKEIYIIFKSKIIKY